MKVALVYSVRTPGQQRFAWKWRAEDGAGACSEQFEYFFECCEDSRKAGFECKFGGAAPTAPQAGVAGAGRLR